MMGEILVPLAVLGLMGLLFGGGLAIAAKVFEVKEDPRIALVRAALPGANCGGCGNPGCDALAKAIVSGEAPVNDCPVGGAEAAKKIAQIMGLTAEDKVQMTACIRCKGDCENAGVRGTLYGVKNCLEAQVAGGGNKICRYGCMGFGSCVSACSFGALTMGEKGLPVVDQSKCTACGQCVRICPNHVIELIPMTQKIHVDCQSPEVGKIVRQACKNGCIGCKACTKVCPTEAIQVENNLARIDHEKCIQCGQCVEKCPTGAITNELKV